jgi:signal transduction histidine kinase
MINSFFSFPQNNKIVDELSIELNRNNKEDTLKVISYLKLATAYYGVNPEKMSQYASSALLLSDKLNFKKGQAESYKLQGASKYTTGDFKNAEVLFLKGLTIFKDIKLDSGIILCLSNIGSIKMVQNEYPEALKYYQNAIRICKKTKADRLAGIAYGNMGIIYNEMKNYDLAIKHFKEALETHIKAKYPDGVASNLGNLGNVYFHKKEYDTALMYFNQALEKNIENNNKFGTAREYGNIANVYSEQKKFDASYTNHIKALSINEELKNKKGLAVNYQGIGDYYLKKNNLDEALNFTKKSNLLAKEIGIKDVQKETYNNLSLIFEKAAQPDSAYIYFKKYIEVKEIIDNENNRKQISRLEIQYEFDSKEERYKTQQLIDNENIKQQQLLLALNNSKLRESNKQRDLVRLNFLRTQSELKSEQLFKNTQKKQLTIAEKEIEIKQKEIKIARLFIQANERQKWFMICGLLLLGIIVSLLFNQSYNRKKTNQKLQLLNAELDIKNAELDTANKIKIRFFSILNHDLRGPVANLIHFLHLQKESPELLDEEIKTRMQNKTITGAENLLSSMEDILLWSKGQMENFKPHPKKIAVGVLFEETEKHFSGVENIQLLFENPENIILNTDENYLKTIMRNLTGNAIKALDKTSNGKIIWKAWQENGQNYLSVQDNGPGADQEQFKALYDEKEVVGIESGLGLHLIRDLAKAINCTIQVTTVLNEGITFKLIL